MRAGWLVHVVTVGALLVACSAGPGPIDRDGTATPAPGSEATGGTPSVTGSTPTPDAEPSGSSGSPGSGRAHLKVSGDVTATIELPKLTSRAFAGGAGLALVWTDRRGDALGIGGPGFTGARGTTPMLVVTFLVAGTHPVLASSSAGECVVRLEEATATHVLGGLTCTGIRVPGGTVDATARFEASS